MPHPPSHSLSPHSPRSRSPSPSPSWLCCFVCRAVGLSMQRTARYCCYSDVTCFRFGSPPPSNDNNLVTLCQLPVQSPQLAISLLLVSFSSVVRERQITQGSKIKWCYE
ncbi:hypothetical protein K440DRAFT_615451 [Wilcoxina mikolae CBS 423.85]|nr:hypothetical protein K440DRAFT_615451 [Wilcoxina mikolae CBS 423.85]